MAKAVTKARKPLKTLQAEKKDPIKWMYLCIVVFVFVLYGNTLNNSYSMDDELVTTSKNETVKRGISAIPEIFTTLYSNENQLKYEYRPIVKASFALEYQLFGMIPGAGHFINLLLYLATCILLFFLLQKLLKKYSIWLAFAITLLFTAHPVHTEVVASLKNRDELLSFLGCLLMLHFVLKYNERKNIWNIIFAIFWFVFALLSKSDAMVFAAIIPLVLYFFSDLKLSKIALIFVLLLIVFLAVHFLPKLFLPPPDRLKFYWENPLFFEKSFLIKFGTGLAGLLFYIKILFFPHPLLFYYGYNQIPLIGLFDLTAIISLLIYGGFFSFSLWKLKSKSLLSFAILYYHIAISLFSNFLVPAMGIVADRYVYTASLGFCIAIPILIFQILKISSVATSLKSGQRNKLILVVATILIFYSAKTISRNKAWKSRSSLYTADVNFLNRSAKANVSYATTLLDEAYKAYKLGDMEKVRAKATEAISYFKKSVEIYPDYYLALNNIGTIYYTLLRKYDLALPYFKMAIEKNPRYVEAHFNLANTYKKLDSASMAEKYFLKTIELDNHYIRAYSELSKLYLTNNLVERAKEINVRMMQIAPESEETQVSFGNFCLIQKDTLNAINYWENAVKINPENYNLCLSISNFYKRHGNREKSAYYDNLANAAKQKIIKNAKSEAN